MENQRLASFDKAVRTAIRNAARTWYRTRPESREGIPLTFTINGDIKLYNEHTKISRRV